MANYNRIHTRVLLVILVIVVLVVGAVWFIQNTGSDTPDADIDSLPGSSQTDLALPHAERKRIWDIEHLAFVLEQKVFPQLKRDLVNPGNPRWGKLLSSDFQAEIPGDVWDDVLTQNLFRFRKVQRSARNSRQADEQGFIAFWKSLRQKFSESESSCKSSIGILRIAPVTKGKLDGEWTTTWKIRIAGTRGGGLIEAVVVVKLLLRELTEDIASKQNWIRSASIEKFQLLEGDRPLMAEMTESSGISTVSLYDGWNEGKFRPNTGGVYLSDYDQDGLIDVLIDDVKGGVALYRGIGNGKFRDVTKEAGLERDPAEPPLWVLSCWADLDGDGDEDLIACDRLYENLGNGKFRDVTEQSNLPLTPAAGYAIADYDGDGQVDLYVCHSGSFRPGQAIAERVSWIDGGLGIDNRLFRNLGGWKFADVTEKTNTGGQGSSCFSAVWLDANGDRKLDLFAINEFGRNSLLIQTPDGTFSETRIDPVFGGFSMGVTAGDFDNDGATDLYVANMYSKAGNRILSNIDPKSYGEDLHKRLEEATTGNKLFASEGDGSFQSLPGKQIVAHVGWAYGPNFVDLNMDGRLDLYATAGFRSTKRGKPDG